jgi:hypothetical protein
MIKTIIAIYPGRFQPFGQHHAKSFKWLQQKFGAKNTYIATSDKVELPKSPFSFLEKKQIIEEYGLGDHVVQTKNPYKAEEILGSLDPSSTTVVFMVGAKDMQNDPRFAMKPKRDGSPSYFQPYDVNKNSLQGFDKHGYLIVGPHVSIAIPGYGEMSGTALRKALGAKVPRSQKIKLFKSVFGWYDESTTNMIFDKLEPLAESKNSIAEMFKKSKSVNTTDKLSEEQIFTKDWWTKIIESVIDEPVSEGYMSQKQNDRHDAKIEKLRKYLRNHIGKEFAYSFNEFPKTVYGVKINEHLLKEGGAGGHMAHPFNIDWVKTGKDLIDVFNKSIVYLEKGPAAVKIDGVNASIRFIELNGKKQFVLDRGSMKPLDVQGITKADLESRFGEGHGMIKIGGTVLDIFNAAISKVTPAIKSLGLWDNPNIMLNIEYVAGSTNVLQYDENFLAIHGLLELYQATEKRRATKEISYNKAAMQDLLNNLAEAANKFNYNVLGSIPTTLTSKPNLSTELNRKYTVTFNSSTKETKTLKQWLDDAKVPDANIKTVDGKTISALSKEVLIKISEGIPLEEFIADPKDYKDAVDGFVIYLATMKLGDAILDKLSSPLGPVKDHEGIVIRDERIYKEPFKITGKFILGGLASSFRK